MPESGNVAPAAQTGSDSGQPPNANRHLVRLGRLASSRLIRSSFVIGALVAAGYLIISDRLRIGAALGSLGLPAAAAAFVSILAALGTTVQIWRLVLAALGSPLPASAAARVLLVGQLGKYLPGSIWPVVAQMELGKSYQVPRSRSASASVITMLLALITGLITSLVMLPFAAGAMPFRWALLAVPVLAILLYPRVLNAVVGRLLRLARQPPLEAPLTGRTLIAALLWALGTWICYGLQIWILATSLGAPAGKTALIAVGGFAFAWSVGFLVIFAPAGAGVRDVLLLLLLGQVLSTARATAVMLVSRVLLTVADVLAAVVALYYSRWRPGSGAQRPDQDGAPGCVTD